jgi:hypothetical protein
MPLNLGSIAMLGSGETSLAGGRVFEAIAGNMPQPLRIAVLETPAGFELNSSQVASRVGDFLKTRLSNFNPHIDIVPARKRGTDFSPDDAAILAPLRDANLIFMGPGSPTYTVRQLHGSLAWDLIRARHRQGAALVFASAATVSIGAWAIPVYEIYKVGEDVHTVPGLDLFADFKLPLSFIPHWNNTDGGADVDTSRCFIGLDRFNQWCAMLPPGHTTVGLDEHTGIILDFAAGKCLVTGVSSVTLLRECNPVIYPSGAGFALSELGEFHWPATPGEGISTAAWELAQLVPAPAEVEEETPEEVTRLAEARVQARQRKDWAASDRLRDEIAGLGWQVQDTPTGQSLGKIPKSKKGA